ncbi:hypothetical protein QOK74_08015 [Staphylococcus saprophyticus]|uniref:DUF3846 domain-containing protein n=1 Tax=Staphylococcus saprophyticus TaxID=29385 RepID=UPI0024C3DF6C|nr:hypothetical protein [Staphylococcus saprophyticus]MDK1672815.1 hypothetical protein [Staphylococcus saprophyticus]
MTYLKYEEATKSLKEVSPFESETTLEFMYRTLECTLVNIGCNFEGIDIWVDDEALNTGNYEFINTIRFTEDEREEVILVGDMLFASSDNEGNTIPLNEHQKKYIENSVEIESISGSEYLSRMNDNQYNDGI